MLLGTNVTVSPMYTGRSVWVEMSLGLFVGGRSVKVPRNVLSINRLSYLLTFHPSCTHGSTSNISPRNLISVLDTPTSTSYFHPFMSQSTYTVPFYSFIFPTGPISSCYWGRAGFFHFIFKITFTSTVKKTRLCSHPFIIRCIVFRE
jgi:hypothetical protein